MGSEENIIACGSKRKRLSLSDEENVDDMPKAKHSNIEKSLNILNFSDEILLELFQYLDCFSLVNVLKTCSRMSNVAVDNRLWKYFDISSRPLKTAEILSMVKYVNVSTIDFKVRGITTTRPRIKRKNYTLTPMILYRIKKACPRLTNMTIYDGFFNKNHMIIHRFPRTLETLTFVKCHYINFQFMDIILPNLRELNLINCEWFQTHDLLIFSKLPELRVLNLTGCIMMRDCVQYGSLASRSGFKKLEILNLTHTPVSDSDIQCFNIIHSLKELIIECPLYLRSESPNTTVHYLPPRINLDRVIDNNQPPPVDEGEEEEEEEEDDDEEDEEEDEDEDDEDLNDNELLALEVEEEEHDLNAQFLRNVNFRIFDYSNIRRPLRGPFLRRPNQIPVPIRLEPVNEEPNRNPPQLVNPEIPLPNENQRNEDIRGNHVIIVRPNLERYNRVFLFDENERLPNDRFYVFERNYPLVSDRGICSYGIARQNVQEGIIWFRAEARPPNTLIEKFVLRHYKGITDVSLKHLVSCAPNLKYIDLTGTSVTSEGVQKFLEEKPHCAVIF